MNNSGQRVNGRHKGDQYKPVHTQWMIPPQQMKNNQAIKHMAIMAERDNAIRERNIALSEKKATLAERDMALLQRDAAIAECNTAIIERDKAIAALGGPGCLPHRFPPPQLTNQPYNHPREMHVKKRPRNETKSQKTSKPRTSKGLNKQIPFVKPLNDWRSNMGGTKHQNEWKDQDVGLNQVTFDESTMPAPVCSCTGKHQQCYKWGNGGWQSACCTNTLSMYPLPVMPNKRHGRIGGRKMSGSVFTKLLSRMAANGHDLSVPVNLRDHWSKHGTNRYITIK